MNSSELCGDEARFSYCEKGQDIFVSMTLPLFDDLAISSIRCSCSDDSLIFDPPRCHHMWASQYALKETLKFHSQTDATAGGWESFFEEAVEWASQDDEIVEDVYRIRWVWRESGDIGPVLQKLSDGNWSRGRILSWKEFFDSKQYWKGVDPLLASHVKLLDSYNDRYQIDLGPMLSIFLSEAELYCEHNRDAQIQILESSFRIKVLELGDQIEVHGVFGTENNKSSRDQLIENWGYFSYQAKDKRLYVQKLDSKQLRIVKPF